MIEICFFEDTMKSFFNLVNLNNIIKNKRKLMQDYSEILNSNELMIMKAFEIIPQIYVYCVNNDIRIKKIQIIYYCMDVADLRFHIDNDSMQYEKIIFEGSEEEKRLFLFLETFKIYSADRGDKDKHGSHDAYMGTEKEFEEEREQLVDFDITIKMKRNISTYNTLIKEIEYQNEI
jgi:hypothetical protein